MDIFFFECRCTRPGWGSEWSGLMEGIPVHCSGVGARWSLRSISTQTILWFYYMFFSIIFCLLLLNFFCFLWSSTFTLLPIISGEVIVPQKFSGKLSYEECHKMSTTSKLYTSFYAKLNPEQRLEPVAKDKLSFLQN